MSQPLDTTVQTNSWRELIHREEHSKQNWKKQYRPDLEVQERKQLLESLKKEKEGLERKRMQMEERECLYREGRLKYLEQQRKKDPKLRYGSPCTSSQQVGWMADDCEYGDTNIQHHRKLIIEKSFYRKCNHG